MTDRTDRTDHPNGADQPDRVDRPYLYVDPANTAGHATALTTITPMRWWGRYWLPVAFWLGRHIKASEKKLMALSFIQAASWHVVRRIPGDRSLPRRERVRDLLVFQTNFNDSWSAYIDAFSFSVAPRMWMAWGSSLGYPGARPTDRFREYIRHNDLPCSYYFCAYPDGTASTTTAALALSRRFDGLVESWPGPDADADTDAACEQAWLRFLTDVQHDL